MALLSTATERPFQTVTEYLTMTLNSGHPTVVDRYLKLTENQSLCFEHNQEWRQTVEARAHAMARHYRSDVHVICETDRRSLFILRYHQAMGQE